MSCSFVCIVVTKFIRFKLECYMCYNRNISLLSHHLANLHPYMLINTIFVKLKVSRSISPRAQQIRR